MDEEYDMLITFKSRIKVRRDTYPEHVKTCLEACELEKEQSSFIDLVSLGSKNWKIEPYYPGGEVL